MLENRSLHEKLLKVAITGQLKRDETTALAAVDQNKVTAMRLLTWIGALQMNDCVPK